MEKLLTENEVSGFMEKANLGKHTSRFLKKAKRSEKKLNESKEGDKKGAISNDTKRMIAEAVVKQLKEQFGAPEEDSAKGMY